MRYTSITITRFSEDAVSGAGEKSDSPSGKSDIHKTSLVPNHTLGISMPADAKPTATTASLNMARDSKLNKNENPSTNGTSSSNRQDSTPASCHICLEMLRSSDLIIKLSCCDLSYQHVECLVAWTVMDRGSHPVLRFPQCVKCRCPFLPSLFHASIAAIATGALQVIDTSSPNSVVNNKMQEGTEAQEEVASVEVALKQVDKRMLDVDRHARIGRHSEYPRFEAYYAMLDADEEAEDFRAEYEESHEEEYYEEEKSAEEDAGGMEYEEEEERHEGDEDYGEDLDVDGDDNEENDAGYACQSSHTLSDNADKENRTGDQESGGAGKHRGWHGEEEDGSSEDDKIQ